MSKSDCNILHQETLLHFNPHLSPALLNYAQFFCSLGAILKSYGKYGKVRLAVSN